MRGGRAWAGTHSAQGSGRRPVSPTSYLCLESGLAPTLEDSAGTCQAGLGLSLFDPAAPAPAPLSLIPLPVGVELGFVARTIGDSEASPGMPSLDYHRPPPCRGWGTALQTGRLGFSTPGLCFCPHTPVSAPSGLTAPAPVEGGVEVRELQLHLTEVCSVSLPAERREAVLLEDLPSARATESPGSSGQGDKDVRTGSKDREQKPNSGAERGLLALAGESRWWEWGRGAGPEPRGPQMPG